MDNAQELELLRLREQSPSRPIDWRWKRAILLEDHKAAMRKFDDKVVTRIRKFLRDQRMGRSWEQLSKSYPLLYEINYIYNSASSVRWSMEAYLLAGLDFTDIAIRLGFEAEYGATVVAEYEKCRFDIVGRINSSSFIANEVIGKTSGGNLPAAEERIWKLLAWVGYRQKMAAAILDGYMLLEHMPDEVKNWYDTFIEQQLARRTTQSLLKLDPVYHPEVLNLIQTHNDARKLNIEVIERIGARISGELEDSQTKLLEAISISTVNLKKICNNGIETRSDDMIASDIETAVQSQMKALPGKTEESSDK